MRGPGAPVVEADAGHRHHALRLDEDLAFIVLGRPDHVPDVVVRPPVPGPVPRVTPRWPRSSPAAAAGQRVASASSPRDRAIASASCAASTKRPAMNTDSATPPGRLGAVWKDSPGRSEKTLRLRQSFQSARPMSGSPCGPEPAQREVDAPPQVVVERRLRAVLVVPRHGDVEDRQVAGLLEVGRDPQDEPRGVVVEPGADVVVAALRERLVLVIGAAIGQLGRGDVQDPRAGPLRDHVDEARAGPGWSPGTPCPVRCPTRTSTRSETG